MKRQISRKFYLTLSMSIITLLALGSTTYAWFVASRLSRGNIADIKAMDMIKVNYDKTYTLTDDYPTLASLQENNITSVEMSAYDPFIRDNNLINNAILVINCSVEFIGQLQLDIVSNGSIANQPLSHVIQVESLFYSTYTESLDFTTISALFDSETPFALYDTVSQTQYSYSKSFNTTGPSSDSYLFVNISYNENNVQVFLSSEATDGVYDITDVPSLKFESDLRATLIPQVGGTV